MGSATEVVMLKREWMTKSQRMALLGFVCALVLIGLSVWLGDAMLHHRFFRG
jgi:hypothetical protein